MAVARRGAAAAAGDQLVTLAEVQALLASAGGAITGEVRALAGASVPTGWLTADGSAVSRTTYAALYTAIGTAHGSGDGSTTFNLPDLRGRVVAGVSAVASDPFQTLGAKPGEQQHTLALGEMPSHSHSLTDPGHGHTENAHNHGINDSGHTHDYNHSHGFYDNQHSHGAYTNNAGNHSHGPTSGTGFLIYNGTSVTRGHSASGTTSTNFFFQTPTQSDMIFGGIAGVGDHSHGAGTNGSGSNTGINGTGPINTGVSGTGISTQNATPTINNSTTGITMGSAGSGTPHNVIQPSIALTYIVKT